MKSLEKNGGDSSAMKLILMVVVLLVGMMVFSINSSLEGGLLTWNIERVESFLTILSNLS